MIQDIINFAQDNQGFDITRQVKKIVELAGRIDRVRKAQKYLSPGDKAQPNLTTQVKEHLDDLGIALVELEQRINATPRTSKERRANDS
jgi:hypothetical protein